MRRWMPTGWSCLLAVVVTTQAARIPTDDQAEPRLLTLRLRDPYLALEAEGDDTRTRLPDTPLTRDITTDWTPSVGFGLEGSLYHARLLHFNAEVELGITRGERTHDHGDGTSSTDERKFDVQRYNVSATLLRAKPYSVTLFARRSTERRDYDQFNRFDVDHESYGLHLRHLGQPTSWDARFTHTVDEVSDSDRPSYDEEDQFTFDARRPRANDSSTTLRYSRREYYRKEDEAPGYQGIQQNLYVLDEARLGPRPQSRLLSSVNLTDLGESSHDTRTLVLREDLRREHRDHLWSGGIYQFDHRETDEASSDQHNGELYIEHQLYESLESRLDAQMEHGLNKDDQSSDKFLRYGPGLTEHYTKQLRDFGRLGLDINYRFDVIDQEGSGDSQQILGEVIRLDSGRPALLSQPNLEPTSIVVRDSSGTRIYTEGLDYRVVDRGDFTEIQRVFGGAIPNGSEVSVDYRTDQGTSDSLYRTEQKFGFELDLYDRLLLLYGSLRSVLHSSEDSLVYQDYREATTGVKSRWGWLEVGLEYVDYDADALSYAGPNYFSDVLLNYGDADLRLHAGRSDLTYRTTDGKLDTRTYTATYDWHPIQTLSLQLFGGDYQEYTQDGERDLVSAECRLVLIFNLLTVEGTYRYEDEDARGDNYSRRYYLVRVKRDL